MNLSKIVITLLFLTSTQVFAGDMKAEMLSKAKAMASKNIEKQMGVLKDLKSCITSAGDRGALKKCRKEAKSKREALRASNKAERQSIKDQRNKMKEAGKKFLK